MHLHCKLQEDMFTMKIKIKVIIAVTIAALFIFSAAVRCGLIMAIFSLKHGDFFLYPKICSHINFGKQRFDAIDASEDDKIIIQISERQLLSNKHMSSKENFDRMLSIYDELSVYKSDVNVIFTESNGAPEFSLTKNFFKISSSVKPETGDPEFTVDHIMKKILERDNIYYADLGFFSFSDSSSDHWENNSLRFIRGWLKCGEKADLTDLHSLEALDVIIYDDGEFSPHDIIGIENLKALVIEICNDNIRPSDDTSERYNNIKDVYILKNNISEADLNRIGVYFPNASISAMDYNEKAQSECFDNISKKYFD